MQLIHYIDAAKARLGGISDRQLNKRLGVSPIWLHQARKGVNLPSEETMLRLADLAAIDREKALLDLNIWRAKSPEAKALYQHIAERLTAAVMALGFVLLSSGGNPAQATPNMNNAHQVIPPYTLSDNLISTAGSVGTATL